MKVKTCTKCNKEQPVANFRRDKSRKDGRRSDCKYCSRLLQSKRYEESYRTKILAKARHQSMLRREYIREYKQKHMCQICGEADDCCLEFHHLDASQKQFTIATSGNRSLEDVISEIQKCVILCSNCHKKVHAGKFNDSITDSLTS